MSIENRALSSCKARLGKAEADYNMSNGNANTKKKKYQQVRLFRYILNAVEYYIECQKRDDERPIPSDDD